MLSRGKVTPATVSYYSDEVAAGIEDYYAGRGEAPGRWVGRGSTAAGLHGEVSATQLARLFGGEHPDTGAPLGNAYRVRDGADRVTGWDLTFSAPKSVSVLWAVGGGAIGMEVREAHDAAVAAGLDHLEEHAAFSRQGKAGIRQVDTEGLVAAAFVHRTSRAGDPQLHTHVLVSGRVRCGDGVWRALDSRALHRELKTAGMAYQAVLRVELTRRLGLSWTAVDRHGQAEVEGVPQGLRRRFSTRRSAVEAAAGRRVSELEVAKGRSLTPAERRGVHRHAVLESRNPKDHGVLSDEGLHDRWTRQAAEAGFGPDRWLPDALGRAPARRGADVEAIVAETIAELERSVSTWTRTDVIRQVLRRTPSTLPAFFDTRRWVEDVADLILSVPEVVRLGAPEPPPSSALRRRDGRSVYERHGATRYSTRATLAREQHVLDVATAGRGAERAVAHRDWVESAIDEAGLGEDQAAAVRKITLGGDAIGCVVGPAGTGKSRAMGAAGRAWRDSGIAVRGLAVSATAAGVLQAQAAIPAETVAKLLHEHDRPEGPGLGWRLRPGEIVVVDEAAMLSSADLCRLVTIADRAQAKLVLVGDHAQLGAVEAGGLFRLLAADEPSAELVEVRRFDHSWEAAASLRLRRRDPEVIATYADHGRVAGGDEAAVTDAAFDHWQRARVAGESVVVCAGDHATVDALARRARTARVAAGEVEAGGVYLGDQVVGVGDEVVTTRNDRRLVTTGGGWVRNGDRWTVTARHGDDSLTVEDLGGRGRLRLPTDYVGHHLALAYAVTVHKAQGLTVDRAVLVADDSTTAEGLYVGLTRGRRSNHALAVTDAPDLEHRHPGGAACAVLESATRREAADRAATQVQRHELESSESLVVLAPRLANLDAWIAAEAPKDRSEELQRLDVRRAHLERYARPGLLTQHGRDERRLVRSAEKEWMVLQAAEDHRTAWFEDHSDTISYRNELAVAVERRRAELGADAARHQPEHVVRLLGPLPERAEDAADWIMHASRIEAYREEWDVDPARIGQRPRDQIQQQAWNRSVRFYEIVAPLGQAPSVALDARLQRHTPRSIDQGLGIEL